MTKIRRFTLRDASILIAALAVAFGLIRAARGLESSVGDNWQLRAMKGSLASLGPITLALLVLRLLPPRPRLRRLARQPGYIADVAALAGVAVVGIFWIGQQIYRLATGYRSDHYLDNVIYVLALTAAGLSVLTSWLTLALVGCRAEPSWIDRSSRVLGLAWILVSAGFWAMMLVQL